MAWLKFFWALIQLVWLLWYLFGACSVYAYLQSVELCSACYEKYGHEHAMRKQSADVGSPTAAGSIDSSSSVIQRCIDTVAHATACTQGTACPRQPECGKMMDVLRHARACTLRTTCTVCQQLMALCVTHARACTTDASVCHVPFCSELRRHIQRRQTLQRQQQHLMDDRRRAVMTSASVSDSNATQVNDGVDNIQPDGDGDAGQRCVGKGGDRQKQSALVTATGTNAADVATSQDHQPAGKDASLHCSHSIVAAENSTVASARLTTSNRSIPKVNGDLPAAIGSTGNADTMHYSSVPKTAAISISDAKFVDIKSAGDGPSSEVLYTSEYSARHQIVVGCLRVLKKLHPSMSKQNLLQLLCHCSRQQLTALQDKVRISVFYIF